MTRTREGKGARAIDGVLRTSNMAHASLAPDGHERALAVCPCSKPLPPLVASEEGGRGEVWQHTAFTRGVAPAAARAPRVLTCKVLEDGDACSLHGWSSCLEG